MTAPGDQGTLRRFCSWPGSAPAGSLSRLPGSWNNDRII